LKTDFPDFINNDWFAHSWTMPRIRLVAPVLGALVVLGALALQVRRSARLEPAFAVAWVGANLFVIAYSAVLFFFTEDEGSIGASGLQDWHFALSIAIASVDTVIVTFLVIDALSRIRWLTDLSAIALRTVPIGFVALVLLANTVHLGAQKLTSDATDVRLEVMRAG
jgi:hypothetical protein